MNTFPIHYGFFALWTFSCFCGGWLISFWVLSLCRSSSRADECAGCLRRRSEWEREEQALKASSAIIFPNITTPARAIPEEDRGARAAGTISPAPDPVSGPDATDNAVGKLPRRMA